MRIESVPKAKGNGYSKPHQTSVKQNKNKNKNKKNTEENEDFPRKVADEKIKVRRKGRIYSMPP